MTEPTSAQDLFKGRHFDQEIIILCVRWYITFKLSFRDLVQMMAERGITLCHTTILRWVQQYVPEFEKRWQGTAKRREGSPTLPSYPHEGGRQPNAHWLGDGPGDVGHQPLAAHQADHRSNASTETPGCSGLAGQFGDVCKGDRIVSGTAVM